LAERRLIEMPSQAPPRRTREHAVDFGLANRERLRKRNLVMRELVKSTRAFWRAHHERACWHDHHRRTAIRAFLELGLRLRCLFLLLLGREDGWPHHHIPVVLLFQIRLIVPSDGEHGLQLLSCHESAALTGAGFWIDRRACRAFTIIGETKMWFITDAWARRSGGSAVHHHGSGFYPSDSETGLALIGGAILIGIGWVLFEFFKMHREKRKRQQARPPVTSIQLDGRSSRLNDRVRSVTIKD
jgi:hypothetical protein